MFMICSLRSEEKAVLLFESGCRMLIKEFECPKGMMPSGFSMKVTQAPADKAPCFTHLMLGLRPERHFQWRQ